MPDPSLSSALALAMEGAINQALRYDPGPRAGLAKLGTRLIKLDLCSPKLALYFQLGGERLRVKSANDDQLDPPDVILSGELKDFFAYLNTAQHSLADSGLQVQGRIALLNELKNVLDQLDIDWEDFLVEHLGYQVGPGVASLIKFGLSNLQQIKETLSERAEPVLSDELNLIAHSEEVKSFIDEVDEIRARAERLARRVELLHAKNKADT